MGVGWVVLVVGRRWDGYNLFPSFHFISSLDTSCMHHINQFVCLFVSLSLVHLSLFCFLFLFLFELSRSLVPMVWQVTHTSIYPFNSRLFPSHMTNIKIIVALLFLDPSSWITVSEPRSLFNLVG